MPIHCPLPIRDLSAEEFDTIDRIVMRHAFDCQNELGRLCDEKVYETDLALRLKTAGHDVQSQVPVHVTHREFNKTYYLDLVCDHAVYEAKTTKMLTGDHHAQVLGYAMMLDVRHIKLLNFRPSKVEGSLRYCPLTNHMRHSCKISDSHWQQMSDQCQQLRDYMTALLFDWGAFLDARLYEEALTLLCGGEAVVAHKAELCRAGHIIGRHRTLCHGENMCFSVSAVTDSLPAYRSQLQRLLQLTRLKGLQWINLCRDQLQFMTLTNPQ